jgi:zinc transport system ATP-binding protein
MRCVCNKKLFGILQERVVPIIKAENLFFSYTGSQPYVLEGVELEIPAGQYVSVVGENGSGKSTLMRLILKFIKPTIGSIGCRAGRIGYVPQKNDFSNANFPITVYEMLNSYRKLLKLKGKGMIAENLEQVGMSSFTGALTGTLSGGQSQKILIARALMGNPDLLILDEPSAGVDMGSQKEIYGFLKKINKEKGITIVSVEHNLAAAMANSTLLYHLSEGRGRLYTPRAYAGKYWNNKGKGYGIV